MNLDQANTHNLDDITVCENDDKTTNGVQLKKSFQIHIDTEVNNKER